MIIVQSFLDKDFLKYCYDKDNDLINKYHQKAGEGIDVCIEDELNVIKNNNVQIFKMYDVNDNLIGYFGKQSENTLTGYFILPEYRKSQEIHTKILDSFTKPTYTAVYLKNIPALKFLKKNNFEFVNMYKTDNQLSSLMVRG